MSRARPCSSLPDRYRYDPGDPTPAVGGTSISARNAGAKDQRPLESRDDVLTYTSAVLGEDLMVIDPMHADLSVRSTLVHTDFFVRLCDVSPGGGGRRTSVTGWFACGRVP